LTTRDFTRRDASTRPIFVIAFFARTSSSDSKWDIRNDEAIYDYAVDRILETGEWRRAQLRPPEVSREPPSEVWIVAAGIKSACHVRRVGCASSMPRFVARGLSVVYLFGRMLAGTAGVWSVFMLYLRSVRFEHGGREKKHGRRRWCDLLRWAGTIRAMGRRGRVRTPPGNALASPLVTLAA